MYAEKSDLLNGIGSIHWGECGSLSDWMGLAEKNRDDFNLGFNI